jgi:ATP-dependent Clp protease ATP-binding subunit ClpA
MLPIEVAPANEEAAVQVLQGIKEAYEKFHNVSYTTIVSICTY